MIRLQASREVLKVMFDDCRARLPEEACGVLIGRGAIVERAVAIENVADDKAHGFSFCGRAWLDVLMMCEQMGYEVVGVYHSHPSSDARLSAHDLKMMREQMPNVVQLVVSLRGEQPEMGVYVLDGESVVPVAMVWGKDGQIRGEVAETTSIHGQWLMGILTLLVGVILVMVAVHLLPPAPVLN